MAMAYFPSAECILESKSLGTHGGKWLNDIDEIVSVFHAEGYVHGDLRPPNFIVDGEKLLLVDFDWGGKEKEVMFPLERLHPILRGSRSETYITKERDEVVMKNTKHKIGNKLEECMRS